MRSSRGRLFMRSKPEKSLLWEPISEPQRLALESGADELLYGGAAGGGKTDLLIGTPLLEHERAIIFRREYSQMTAIIDRTHDVIGDAGRWNGQMRRWRLRGNRLIDFGSMPGERDKIRYRGRPYDFIGFDEGAEFSEMMYRFAIAWNRSATGKRCRVILASNPPSSGEGEWVIRYWSAWLDPDHPNPAAPGELRWYVVSDGQDIEADGPGPIERGGEILRPRSRTFIPARLDDNPVLRETHYRSVLQALPEPLRSQLLAGDFMAGREPDDWQLIPESWVRAAMDRWKATPRPKCLMTAMGCDVSRGGSSKTVLAPRWREWFGEPVKRSGKETPTGAHILTLIESLHEGNAVVNIDPIGVGSSPYDALMASDMPVNGVNFGAGSERTDRSGQYGFVNLRAEAYWKLREGLDPENGLMLCLPPDDELRRDLCAVRWRKTPRGIVIESKEELRQRLGRSPDCGDAVVYAWFREGGFDVLTGGTRETTVMLAG